MKIGRQAKIIELIGRYDIETQEELCTRLNEEGYEVTQATVSRDIRELKLTKVAGKNGRQIYKVIDTALDITPQHIGILRNAFVSMDIAQNIFVIKTHPGMAMAVAAALDGFDYKQVVGTLAGDDNIFILCRSEEDAVEVMKQVHDLLDKD